MENEYIKVMSNRTDTQLIKIVTVEREKYQPLAIKAAEEELKTRNIDSTVFEKIREDATTDKQQKRKVNSNVAGSGIRFVNFLIDLVIWLFIAGMLTLPLTSNNELHMLLGYLILFGTYLGYYAIMEIKFQKTVGKFVTKTKVVKLSGEKPTTGDIIMRTFCRLIPFDRLSFLFVKNGIHDFLSKTKVIKDKSV